jgi:hypothetical protein
MWCSAQGVLHFPGKFLPNKSPGADKRPISIDFLHLQNSGLQTALQIHSPSLSIASPKQNEQCSQQPTTLGGSTNEKNQAKQPARRFEG